MTKDRYNALMAWDSELELTPEEFKQGWHFCHEFDGLLRSNEHQEPDEFKCECMKPKAIDWRKAKQDTRPQKDWWAPGEYLCWCRTCKSGFIGDKRAGTCADCAYKKP